MVYKVKTELRNPLSISGMLLMVFASGLLLTITVLVYTFQEPYERYDHNAIAERGIPLNATVKAIETKDNIRVFGKSPRVIRYTFASGAQQQEGKFQTMESEKVDKLKAGDTIAVKFYKGRTTIEHITPYSFPAYLFNIFPAVLFLAGAFLVYKGLQERYKRARP